MRQKKKRFAFAGICAVLLLCICGLVACADNGSEHTLVRHAYVAPTCTADGNIEYWECTDCSKLFADKKGKQEITQTVLPARHSYAADWSRDVRYHWHVPVCACENVPVEKLPHTFVNGVCTDCGYTFTYTEGLAFSRVNDEPYYMVSGIGTVSDTDINVPPQYCGLPVTGIANGAFRDCRNITSVVIPDSITSIGNSAFWHCSSLTSVKLPNRLSSIGYNTFYDCDSLTLEIPSSVTDIFHSSVSPFYGVPHIILQEGTESIFPNMFNGCSTLQSIVVPSSVTNIGDYAFEYCSSLTSITIPSSVTNIGYRAFFGCDNLIRMIDGVAYVNHWVVGCDSSATEVFIPSDACIANNAFTEYHRKLTSITVDANHAQCSSIDGVLYNKTQTEIIYVPKAKSSTMSIPSSVTSIGAGKFSGCHSLTSIEIPSGVTNIEYGAFAECYCATVYCEVASKPNGWADGWHSSDCPVVWNYKNNDADEDGKVYTVVNGMRFSIQDGVATVARQPLHIGENISIPASIVYKSVRYSVTSIEKQAFYNRSIPHHLTSIEIPSSVTSIGYDAFRDCPIEKATIPTIAIESIKNSMLKKVSIISGTSIGEDAFEGCDSLTSVNVPSSVTSIDDWVFYNCRSLASITVDANNSHYSSQDGILYNKAKTDIVWVPKAISGSVTIPSSVTRIGNGAFNDCRNLTSVEIQQGVTSIGGRAFGYCSSLTSIVIPDSVTNIEDSAFYGCRGLDIYCKTESKPSGWSGGWLYNCSVTVHWGDTLEYINNIIKS